MYKQYQDIKNIEFPVYALPDSGWYKQDGVLFLDGRVLDDTNMPGKTLGVRRIQCGRTDLCPLKRAYTGLAPMLQSSKKIFIDSNGVPFIYNKTKNFDLKYHKVSNIEKRETSTTVWLENVSHAFSIPRPPYGDARWARVLYYGRLPWMIYDFQINKGKDSFRRV